jgi:hypothetical protein
MVAVLFQGTFDKDLLAFTPGWNSNAQMLATFTDAREPQPRLNAKAVTLVSEADEGTTGPVSFMAVAPHETPILVDRHV